MLPVRQRKGVALRASRYVRAKALTFHQRAWRFAPSYFRGAPFDFAQGKEALRFHPKRDCFALRPGVKAEAPTA